MGTMVYKMKVSQLYSGELESQNDSSVSYKLSKNALKMMRKKDSWELRRLWEKGDWQAKSEIEKKWKKYSSNTEYSRLNDKWRVCKFIGDQEIFFMSH
jgi:hypothetical protein